MYRIFSIGLLLISGMAIVLPAQNQTYAQWGGLQPGSYAVGYRVFNQYDYGRHIQPRRDFEGKLNTSPSALPIQVSMWYPAQVSKTPKIRFVEYLYLDEQKNNFRALSNAQKAEIGNSLRFLASFGLGMEISEVELHAVLQTPTAAARNAPPLKGPFPVILAGVDGGPGTYNVLAEYLASLGYVVLLTPSIDHTGTWQAKQPQLALAERIGNFEYLLAFLRQHTFADPQRIGVLGGNFDGMSALLFQMKNIQADAVASVDGWEGKAGLEAILFQSAFFDPNKLRVPYLNFLQDEKDPSPSLQLSQAVLDTLRYAERYSYVLRGMNHFCLIGNLGILPNLPEEKRQAYRFLYTRIGQFFDAHVKKLPEAQTALYKSALGLGYSTDLLKVEIQKPALASVPTPEEFEKIVMSGDLDKAMSVLKSGKKDNPTLQIFDFQALNLFAFRFAQQQNKAKVLAIWQLGAEAFPQSPQVFDRLGDAYQGVGDDVQARTQFSKALLLLEKATQSDSLEQVQLRQSIQAKLKP